MRGETHDCYQTPTAGKRIPHGGNQSHGGPPCVRGHAKAIADDLGVSEGLVSEVANDPDVKQFTREPINTDEKREQVREYVEDNPTTPA
jgi:hypothetical protein